MKKLGAVFVCVLLASFFATPALGTVPVYPMIPNTFLGGGVGDDAGYFGAPAGSQAALYSFIGSELSIDVSGLSGLGPIVVNIPQASAALGAALGAGGPLGLPTPAGFIFETTTLKNGPSIVFGQEMTGVVGGLFPTALTPLVFGAAADNGLAPGSAAADGGFDQMSPLAVPMLPIVSYAVSFGPGSIGLGPFLGAYPAPPVFEIREDVPPITDLNIGVGSNIEEMHFDFDGTTPAAPPLIGPAVPPPTGVPSQFENTGAVEVANYSLPQQVAAATDGSLFAAGFIDTGTALYTFFDPSVIMSGGPQPIPLVGPGPTGGWVYRVEFTGKGVVTEGSILSDYGLLPPDPNDLAAWNGQAINITFAVTLFGEAYATVGNGIGGFVPGDGEDPFGAWGLRTSLAGNSGDASFTITPLPEPTTFALFGLGVVPLLLRRRKKKQS